MARILSCVGDAGGATSGGDLMTQAPGENRRMRGIQSKISSRGQVLVPAAVRDHLHLRPGPLLVWTREGDRIVVERAARHSTTEVLQALFGSASRPVAPPKSLEESKQGVREHVRRRHAGR